MQDVPTLHQVQASPPTPQAAVRASQPTAIEISSDESSQDQAAAAAEDSDSSSVGRPDDMEPAEDSDESDTMNSDEDGEEEVAGLPGAAYRGFGRCFNCSECSLFPQGPGHSVSGLFNGQGQVRSGAGVRGRLVIE